MAESVLFQFLGAVALSFVLAGTIGLAAGPGHLFRLYRHRRGLIPALVANRASQIGIGRLFEAVRKQVKDPK